MYRVGDRVVVVMSPDGHSPRRINSCNGVVGKEYIVGIVHMNGVNLVDPDDGQTIYNGYAMHENVKLVKEVEITLNYKIDGVLKGRENVHK